MKHETIRRKSDTLKQPLAKSGLASAIFRSTLQKRMTISDTKQQDTYINELRRSGKPVDLTLCNGQNIKGFVKGFDRYSILILLPGQGNVLIFKHAIAAMSFASFAEIPTSEKEREVPKPPARKTLRDVVIPEKDMLKPIVAGPDVIEPKKKTRAAAKTSEKTKVTAPEKTKAKKTVPASKENKSGVAKNNKTVEK